MGGFASQVQESQTGQPSGKGGPISQAAQSVSSPPVDSTTAPKPLNGIQNAYFAQPPRPMGKGGAQTNSATSGQPTMGAPNQYPNTVGQWDNSQIQPVSHGKGKGA